MIRLIFINFCRLFLHIFNVVFIHLVIFYQLSVALPTNIGRYDLIANKNDDGNTRFFLLGDWGGLPFEPYKTPSEIAVANAMGKLGKKLNTSFQISIR